MAVLFSSKMLYRRQGYPEVDEIVLCKVTTIFPNSVFVELMEYSRSGLVHISEVSPGRIRNLREFISLDRIIVCKVLKIDKEKGHIDLSLRRVNSHQRQEKLEEVKQETKAESVVRNLSKKLKKPAEDIYDELTSKLFPEYSHLYLCFRDIVSGDLNLAAKGVENKIAQELSLMVIDKFRPSKIRLEGEIKLQTYDSQGIFKIKSTLLEIEKLSTALKITYLGAGRFKIVLEDTDYKPAEKTLASVESIVHKFRDKLSTASFEREKKE